MGETLIFRKDAGGHAMQGSNVLEIVRSGNVKHRTAGKAKSCRFYKMLAVAVNA